MPSTQPTLPPTTTRFYLPKNRVQPILRSVVTLQKRDDLSGKFSRKCGRVRRQLAAVEEPIVEESQLLEERFKRRDAGGNVVPVVAQNALGQVIFEKDGQGKETDEPVILHGQYYVTDQAAYDKEREQLLAEIVIVDCEPFTEEEIDTFKKIRGDIVDDLMDLSPDSIYTKEPSVPEAPEVDEPAVTASDEVDDDEDRTAP